MITRSPSMSYRGALDDFVSPFNVSLSALYPLRRSNSTMAIDEGCPPVPSYLHEEKVETLFRIRQIYLNEKIPRFSTRFRVNDVSRKKKTTYEIQSSRTTCSTVDSEVTVILKSKPFSPGILGRL